ARECAERITLFLQNEQLRRRQLRSSEYLKQLQNISTAFPSTVKLAKLVDDIYQFTTKVVDVSSMLITLYERDTRKIYDIFVIENGNRVDGLTEQPLVIDPEERLPLWKAAQHEDEMW